MTLNTFEGGTAGATITTANSGGTSGDAFNFVSIAATGAATYIASAYRGSVAGRFASGTTAGIVYAEYTSSVDVAGAGKVYGRGRFRLPVLPSDSTGTRVAVVADNTGSFRMAIHVINTGKIQLRNAAGTTLATSAMTYTAGTWVDLGWSMLAVSSTVGQIELRIWDAFGNVSETLTSTATQNTLGAGGPFKLQAGQVRSQASFTVDVDDLGYSTTGYPAIASAPSVQYGPWSGGVTDGGFTVGYVVAATSSARLVVSLTSDLASPVFSTAVTPDAGGMVKLTVSGLTANTTYYYGIETDGIVQAGKRGSVRTFPTAGAPASFSIAFGSCQFDVPSDSTFTAIAARSGPYGQVRQLVHMGDMNYRDWSGSNTAADVFAQHLVSLGSASMAGMLAAVPIAYLWDNHDWGGDTSDGSAAAGTIVAAQYRRVFPTYTLPASNGRGGYQSWVIGRVRFIQLDVRSYRDPQGAANTPTKTMLGSEQKTWLQARLSDPEPVKIICGNYPWRTGAAGDGRWGSYPDEFTALTSMIASTAAGRVYVIFGDRHFLAADNGSTAGTQGIPQAGGAPFQQASVSPAEVWSQGSYTTDPAVLQAYGVLDIADTGDDITIAYSGITTADGVTRVSMTTTFAVQIDGAGALTLPALDAAGSGALSLTGDGALSLPPVDLAGAGSVALSGAGAPILPALDAAGAGGVLMVGGGAPVLPPLDLAGAGTVTGGPGPGTITGAGLLALPALSTIGTGEVMTCQPLPYDTSCLPPGWPATIGDMDAGQRSAYDFAAELITSLTLSRYGLCTRVARPCSTRCALSAGYSRSAGGWFSPYLYGGRLFNGCGCGPHLACGCGDTRAAVTLAGPVASVVEVLVDGQLVPSSAYTVEGNLLVRTDGELWPLTQDVNAPASAPGTFQVTYVQGAPLPAGGRRALTALMVELHKARCGDASCRLPSRVTNIVREGVTYSMLDDPTSLLAAGNTGIAEVDMWLASVNPTNTRTRMAVWSPDLMRRGR